MENAIVETYNPANEIHSEIMKELIEKVIGLSLDDQEKLFQLIIESYG